METEACKHPTLRGTQCSRKAGAAGLCTQHFRSCFKCPECGSPIVRELAKPAGFATGPDGCFIFYDDGLVPHHCTSCGYSIELQPIRPRRSLEN